MIHEDNINIHKNLYSNIKKLTMTRMQRNLNSPADNLSLRTNNAVKSSSIYYNLDVSHKDLNIIKSKEIDNSRATKDIKDVMKNVIVYVEVRTGEDDHSAGIKKVISQLGAKVNDRLLRNTTHVIFKDGIQSTYNKAIKWKIPIVSILWIEDCKTHIKLMDSNLYPISNKYRYENPELYDKIKKVRYMQLQAEDSCARHKVACSKMTTLKNSPIRPSVRMPRKPRDSLNDIFSQFEEKLMAAADDDDDGDLIPFESKLLEHIRNSSYTQRTKSRLNSFTDSENNTVDDKTSKTQFNAVKILEFTTYDKPSLQSTMQYQNNRKTIHEINNIKESGNDLPERCTSERKPNRKSTIGMNNSSLVSKKTTNSQNRKISSNDISQKKIFDFYSKKNDDSIIDISGKKENMNPCTPVMSGKQLYNTPKFMEPKKSIISDSKVTQQRGNTAFSTPNNSKNIDLLNTIVENDVSDTIIFNSSKKPSNRRKTIFECSMDIIDKSLHNINQLSKLNNLMVDDNKIELASNSLCQKNNSIEGIKSFSSLNISADVIGTPKKRKLFVPQQLLFCTPTGKEIIIDNLKNKSGKRSREEDYGLQSKLKRTYRRTINLCTSTQQQNGKT